MELNVQDLQLAASVIDLATQRGAFKANEAKAVGTIFEKITTFIQQVAEAQAKQKAEAEAAQGESAPEAPAEAEATAE
jgi:hypothetical protein